MPKMTLAHDDAEAQLPPVRDNTSSMERLRQDRDAFKRQTNELAEENQSLFKLIYEIRCAAGDPEGKLMQSELVNKIMEACNDES